MAWPKLAGVSDRNGPLSSAPRAITSPVSAQQSVGWSGVGAAGRDDGVTARGGVATLAIFARREAMGLIANDLCGTGIRDSMLRLSRAETGCGAIMVM